VAALYEVIRTTLADAFERATGLATKEIKGEKKAGLQVHGRARQPCPVCGDTIREVSFSDRALQYCATCQTGGNRWPTGGCPNCSNSDLTISQNPNSIPAPDPEAPHEAHRFGRRKSWPTPCDD